MTDVGKSPAVPEAGARKSPEDGTGRKPNYKNWLPRRMIAAAPLAAVLFWAFFALALAFLPRAGAWLALDGFLALAALAATLLTLWFCALYRMFSYDGKRQLARQIVEGPAAFVKLPAGGRILDVGCGSGALTIACAKGNPACQALGVDLWRGVYASFSQRICEENAAAEGVANTEFRPGDALKLDFPDGSFDAVTSNYVYHNIPKVSGQTMLEETLRVLKKGGVFAIHDIMERGKYGDMEAFAAKLRDEGYEEVKLLDTAKGMFITPTEARFMCCSASKLLVGRK